MNATRWLAVCVGVVGLVACKDLDVPNLNSPGLQDFENNPTRSQVLSVASGLLIGTRTGIAPQNGYVSLLGILGRESYNFDPADPRFVTEMLVGPLDGGSPAFGGNLWSNSYRNIRNASLELAALNKVPLVNDAEKEAIRGFAQTIQALDYLNVINTRDANGAPIVSDLDPLAPPAAIASKDSVFGHIGRLLDSAQAHLDSAGVLTGGDLTFPFALSPGFAGFNTTASFRRFNRALRARVLVYSGSAGCIACWDSALTALSGSFIDTTGDFNIGVFYSYATVSGDETNPLYDPNARALVAHPSFQTDAQLQAGGAPDDRFVRKTATLASPKTTQGLSSQIQYTIYKSNTDPIPIIRNEELILIRAEANIGKGGAALAAAVTDLNEIRTKSGKLPAYAGPVTQAALLDELLYNRRYSLAFEGGHRWIDLRRYGRLGTLPTETTSSGAAKRFAKFPFPQFDCDARSTKPPGCGTEAGF
jgi:starch-binding outer membrane protein, SusD/RagB family